MFTNHQVTDYIMKWIIILGCGVFGLLITEQLLPFLSLTVFKESFYISILNVFVVVFVGGICGSSFGWAFHGKIIAIIRSFSRKVDTQLRDTPTEQLISGAIGVIAGLIIANLFSLAFIQIPYVGKYIPLIFSIFAAYIGGSVCQKKNFEIFRTFNKLGAVKNDLAEKYLENRKLIDTSVIIDGRIEDVFKTGFVDGSLIVPHFVVKELQNLADSADNARRIKGRKALDTLARMRSEYANMIRFDDKDYRDIYEVDLKLLRMAQEYRAKIITVDYNLNKVAMLHGIFVLNVNELANAIKSNIAMGDVINILLTREGKEFGQAVAYLDDGTMIVVEDGKNFINKNVDVLVHSVFQTAAGRMVFARIKIDERLN